MESRPLEKDTEKTEAQKAEEQRRAKEKEGNERAAIEHAEWYIKKILGEKSANYHRVGSPEESKSREAALVAGSKFSLLEPGVYECEGRTTINLTRNKDGSMRAEPLRFGLSSKKAYGDAMDLLASGCGAKTITIDWGSQKDVNMKDLDMLIELARERDLKVEFGPNVIQYMLSRNDNGALYAQYVEKAQKLEIHQHKEFEKKGHPQKTEKFDLMQSRNMLSKTEKLQGNDEADKAQKLKDKVLKEGGNELQGDERLKAIEKELQKDSQRLTAVKGAKDNMEKNVGAQEAQLADPKADPDKVRSVATHATENKADRAEVLSGIRAENDDLKARNKVWIAELDQQSQLLASVANPTDEQKAQIEKIKEMLDGLKSREDVRQTQENSLTGLERRVNQLAENAVGIENKLQAIEAAKLQDGSTINDVKTKFDSYADLDKPMKEHLSDILDKYVQGKDDAAATEAAKQIDAFKTSMVGAPEKASVDAATKLIEDYINKHKEEKAVAAAAPSSPSLGGGSVPM